MKNFNRKQLLKQNFIKSAKNNTPKQYIKRIYDWQSKHDESSIERVEESNQEDDSDSGSPDESNEDEEDKQSEHDIEENKEAKVNQ